ncbi:MAG: hypothetical protein Q8P51_06870 [Ignavibacteria bacterium]|nr:hypothetical protein [Ignavibacteria bacterium]
MKTVILMLSSILFASCMHLGMMGGGSDHQSTVEPVIEKEVTVGDIRATAIVPPLRLGEEALFTLRLIDTRTGQPISGAQVSFHAEYLHKNEEHEMPAHRQMHNKADSITTRRTSQEHDINLNVEVYESASTGTYSTQFAPAQSGEHRVMFHIRSVGGRKLEPEIVVEATRTVPEKMSGHDGGMHGMGGATPYAIIGAALMGAMMVVIWATGGRMF